MIRAFMALSVLVASVSSASTVAEAASLPSVSKLLNADLDQKALQTTAGRRELADAVKGYCDEVGGVYPRNSPSEDQWLASEIAGGGDRPTRAVASPEWGRRQASNFLESCQSLVAYLRKEEHSKGYVGLAYAFLRFASDSDIYARKNGVDPERLGLPSIPRLTTEALLVAALASPE